jgi:hypothetical protein
MQSRGSEGELLSEARENAKELVINSQESALFMINTNELNGREERILNKAEAIEKLENITYSPISRKLDDIISWQNKQLNNEEDSITSNRYLFSDFQKATSTSINDGISNASVYPIQLIPENKDNLYIDSVWFSSPIHQVNKRKELNFKIVNKSGTDLENAEVNISIPPFNKIIYVDVPASSYKTSMISYTDKEYGYKTGEISVVDKHIFFDDKFFFSYNVQKEVNILILGGEDQVPNIGIIYELENFYKATEKEITSVTREDFKDKDLIVINGSNDLSSGIQTYLKEFESTGGSILLFPGKTPNKTDWNNYLSKVKLPSMGAEISTGTKIKTLTYKDPFFRSVFEKESSNLNLPAVSKIFRPGESSSPVNELITLQNGLSLLTYNSNKGSVMMFYSSLSSDFGNFSTDALFSTILLRAAEKSKRKSPLYLKIGWDSSFPVYNAPKEEQAIKVTSESNEFIPENTEVSGVTYLSVKNVSDKGELSAGNYTIKSNKSNLGILSLNYDRIESNPDLLTKESIQELFSNVDQSNIKFAEISSDNPFSTLEIDKPYPYWKICIVITLIFVFTEMLIVRFFK